MKIKLELGLAGPDLVLLCRRLQEVLMPEAGQPTTLYADGRDRKVTPDWLETWSAKSQDFVQAKWAGRGWIRLDPGTIVKISLDEFELELDLLLASLSQVPFTVCSAITIHPDWASGALGAEYLAPSFGDLHWRHGWGCLFRGEGHSRLVSRRWLDFGPWRVLRGPNDTSLVQFHDLGADAATALAQARPGHERMGISPTGGFIQSSFHYSRDLEGLYYPEQRKFHIVINGRDVTQREMLDGCAARLYQLLGADKPLDNIVYVFVEEERGRAHLHELWLRGLECHTFVEGKEVRLDEDYQPTPVKPDWLAQLDNRKD